MVQQEFCLCDTTLGACFFGAFFFYFSTLSMYFKYNLNGILKCVEKLSTLNYLSGPRKLFHFFPHFMVFFADFLSFENM